MAVTFATTIIHQSVFGNKRIVTADVVGTGTGTATGDAFLPAALGLRGFDIVLCGNPVTVSITYDYENEKFVYTRDAGSAGPSTATTVQVTDTKFRIMAVGY